MLEELLELLNDEKMERIAIGVADEVYQNELNHLSELLEKQGLGHLMSKFHYRCSPFRCFKDEGHRMWFVDNGTPEGLFIMAIKTDVNPVGNPLLSKQFKINTNVKVLDGSQESIDFINKQFPLDKPFVKTEMSKGEKTIHV